MNFLRKIFKNDRLQEAQPLRVENVAPAPMTPEPDDAELSAQALMEKMKEVRGTNNKDQHQTAPEEGTTEYYQALANKIRLAHRDAELRTIRFLSFCEQELRKSDLPKEGPGSLGLMEAELYKRIDTAEREGGDLKRRWQYCLATVTVRMMGLDKE